MCCNFQRPLRCYSFGGRLFDCFYMYACSQTKGQHVPNFVYPEPLWRSMWRFESCFSCPGCGLASLWSMFLGGNVVDEEMRINSES